MSTMLRYPRESEWLEADGLGGFASGTVEDIRTRRYHALLLAAATPPTGRTVLVNGLEAWVEQGGRRTALSSQRYLPDVIHPDGATRIAAFELEPWPRWTWRLDDGTEIVHERFVPQGSPAIVLSWKRTRGPRSSARLVVRPLLSGRDSHSLHHENADFHFGAMLGAGQVAWRPYASLPGIHAHTNGDYLHAPEWFRQFAYLDERARGLDFVEDLASPGELSFDLARGEALLVLSAQGLAGSAPPAGDVAAEVRRLRARERRRRAAFPSRLHRAADAYLVKRGDGKTIVAGYPWFTDWGRDTFIALRGLCIAGGRLEEAGDILLQWSGAVSEGMLPNLFPDRGDAPEYNSVDASLWYVIAVNDWLVASNAAGHRVAPRALARLQAAIGLILSGYSAGTRYGIRMDADGLLACGTSGVQLTWMDAKVGDWVVTPRIGKPVEVQALWINALRIGGTISEHWGVAAERARRAFLERFWHEPSGHLADVVDVDHVPGAVDATLRPNQVLALGGLPYPLVDGARAHRVLAVLESKLWTPMGLRSLDPAHPDYRPHYEGGVLERDGSYHQGTVWPWLTGAFVEAWVRGHGGTPEAKAEAYARFVRPYHTHLDEAGLGHVSEIADAERPFTPRGCPFQAWSVGELLRLEASVLAERAPATPSPLASPARP